MLFPQRKTKVLTERHLTTKNILCMVKRRLADAGLPARQLTTHSSRATVMTDLLKQGVPVEDVQYWLGMPIHTLRSCVIAATAR